MLEALSFIRANQHKPFFLYLPLTVPHLALQVPDDALAEYAGKLAELLYQGEQGCLPNCTPRATDAAMITRMDAKVGRILDLLTTLRLDEQTLIIFSSDNGPAWPRGGADMEFFRSTDGFRNYKGSIDRGGLHVPMIAQWKGKVAPRTTSDNISGSWDYYPTFAEIIDAPVPTAVDGISLLPTLPGKERPEHD